MNSQTRSGTIHLAAGQHTIKIAYFDGSEDDVLDVSLSGADTGGIMKGLFASGMLGHADDAVGLMSIDPTDYAAELAGYETIKVLNQFETVANGKGIEVIEFSDGTTWTQEDILANTRVWGTTQADTLNGRDHGDVMFGREGNDTLIGNGGDDVLTGGAGADILTGGAGVDRASYAESSQGVAIDLRSTLGQIGISGGEEVGDVLTGIEDIFGSGYNDILLGNDVSNEIWGGAGNDQISGFDGYDRLWGGTGNDSLDGGDGADFLSGDEDDDTLSGGAGNDILDGGAGNDHLAGGAGDDILLGGTGDDVLSGGLGSDHFVFADTFGNDIITDFDPSDIIDLSGISGIESFGDLLSDHMSQSGTDVVIADGSGNSIVIAAHQLEALTAENFLFG
ncbi:hypothetical protein FALB51S_00430 [Frigidibacter albus]